jgi:hypothetical protein
MPDVAAALSLGSWILPALVLWPLLGAGLVVAAGRAPAPAEAFSSRPGADAGGPDAGGTDAARVRAVETGRGPLDARNLAVAVLIGEALLSVLLWTGLRPRGERVADAIHAPVDPGVGGEHRARR